MDSLLTRRMLAISEKECPSATARIAWIRLTSINVADSMASDNDFINDLRKNLDKFNRKSSMIVSLEVDYYAFVIT
jgi:hypothetical protein